MQAESNSSTYKRSMLIFIAIILFVLIGFTWQTMVEKKIEKKGVYIIGKISEAKATKNGYYIVVNYSYQNKEYSKVYSSKYGGENVGELVFVKVLPEDPGSMLYLEGLKVPGCLSNSNFLDSSWKDMPTCEN